MYYREATFSGLGKKPDALKFLLFLSAHSRQRVVNQRNNVGREMKRVEMGYFATHK